jgi:hypothetical protein
LYFHFSQIDNTLNEVKKKILISFYLDVITWFYFDILFVVNFFFSKHLTDKSILNIQRYIFIVMFIWRRTLWMEKHRKFLKIMDTSQGNRYVCLFILCTKACMRNIALEHQNEYWSARTKDLFSWDHHGVIKVFYVLSCWHN